jgi:hypothetical protein
MNPGIQSAQIDQPVADRRAQEDCQRPACAEVDQATDLHAFARLDTLLPVCFRYNSAAALAPSLR